MDPILLTVLIVGYFLPTIFAIFRNHPSGGGIFALDLFLGWTFLGWLLALVWSLSSTKKSQQIVVVHNNPTGAPTLPAPVTLTSDYIHTFSRNTEIQCPMCAEVIKAEARKCRHCGEYFKEHLVSPVIKGGDWTEIDLKHLPPPTISKDTEERQDPVEKPLPFVEVVAWLRENRLEGYLFFVAAFVTVCVILVFD